MAGPYKTLLQALQASTFLSGVTMAFGEEMVADQGSPLPYVCMVPIGGDVSEGYAMSGVTSPGSDLPLPNQYLDTYTENLWQCSEVFRFYIWAADPSGLPIDNAEAARAVRLSVLSALRDQRGMRDQNGNVFYGLSFRPLRTEWETAAGAVSKNGRALVLTVQIDIPEVIAPPTSIETAVQTTQFNPTVNNAPG